MNKENGELTILVNRVVLLPCPFCGKDPRVEQEGEFGSQITCPDIDCPGCWNRVIYDFHQGVQRWNRRESLAVIEAFIDRGIESMDESGEWSRHAINALLVLQARVDLKLAELGSRSQ